MNMISRGREPGVSIWECMFDRAINDCNDLDIREEASGTTIFSPGEDFVHDVRVCSATRSLRCATPAAKLSAAAPS